MEKIYVICQGYYSDWNIEGFAKTEEEAELICAKHNSEEVQYLSEWYYIEADEIKTTDLKSDIRYKYCFKVSWKEGKSVRILTCEEEGAPILYSYIGRNYPLIEERKEENQYYVTIFCNKKDKKIAEKILYDVFYQYIAQKEEIEQASKCIAEKYMNNMAECMESGE